VDGKVPINDIYKRWVIRVPYSDRTKITVNGGGTVIGSFTGRPKTGAGASPMCYQKLEGRYKTYKF